jgi:hypothetical protein
MPLKLLEKATTNQSPNQHTERKYKYQDQDQFCQDQENYKESMNCKIGSLKILTRLANP